MIEPSVREFGNVAKTLSRNPLGIIALFIVLVYGLACLVIMIGTSLNSSEKLPIIYFLVIFPFTVLAVFTYLVTYKSAQLFAPGDFRSEKTYLELQKMSLTAAASLAIAKQTKFENRSGGQTVTVSDVVKSVEQAVERSMEGSSNASVLWVDDNPDNNIYERQAMEAVGIKFTISTNTNQALHKLRTQSYGAVISDMGRREGPREGYVLLDAMRSRGDQTPVIFYASSNAPEHKRETFTHGGQGCTNDGQELLEMITSIIFKSK